MERINLSKYGFVRSQKEDFSDDGTHFFCYRVGRVRVRKASYEDQVFIAGSINNGNKLDYTEYSQLPHYKDLDKLNGVSKSSVTEQDLIDLYNACIAYEKEYTEAESKVIFPTIEELKDRCNEIRTLRSSELREVLELLKEVSSNLFMTGSEWDIKSIRDGIQSLQRNVSGFDPEKYPQSIQHSNYGRQFVKDTCYDLEPSYSYTSTKEKLEKYI